MFQIKSIIIVCLFACVTFHAKSQLHTGNPNDSIVNCQTGEVTHGYLSDNATIAFTAEIGAGLIRSEIAPSISYQLAVSNYRGHQFGVAGSAYYFFRKNESDHFDVSMNHFLGASYMRFKKDANPFGLSFKYLLKDTQNDFKGDAFMLSSHHIKSGFSLSPALIFSNNFKTIYPSFTITYSMF